MTSGSGGDGVSSSNIAHRDIPRSVPWDTGSATALAPHETDAGLIASSLHLSPFARPRSSSNPYGHGYGHETGPRHTNSGNNRGYSFGSASSGSSRLRYFESLQEESTTQTQARRRSQHTPVFTDGVAANTEHGNGPVSSTTTGPTTMDGSMMANGNGPSGHDQGNATILLSKARLDSAGKHPRAAVVLGVSPKWLFPLHAVRACSCLPAAWWGFRCALTFLGELLLGVGRGSVMALADGDGTGGGSFSGSSNKVEIVCSSTAWAQAERRFRVTEVFLAIIWCSTSAYLSFFFTDCLMMRWLVNYTPFATLMRLLTLNVLIAYVSSLSMWLSGASEDPRMLLPAWVSIATLLTILYHLTQRNINIRKETHASIHVFSYASFATTCALLFQLHLARDNDPVVPIFEMAKVVWTSTGEMIGRLRIGEGRGA